MLHQGIIVHDTDMGLHIVILPSFSGLKPPPDPTIRPGEHDNSLLIQ